MIPKRSGEEFIEEEDLTVCCDPLFYDASKLAVGSLIGLVEATRASVAEHLNSPRPMRTRKPVVREIL